MLIQQNSTPALGIPPGPVGASAPSSYSILVAGTWAAGGGSIGNTSGSAPTTAVGDYSHAVGLAAADTAALGPLLVVVSDGAGNAWTVGTYQVVNYDPTGTVPANVLTWNGQSAQYDATNLPLVSIGAVNADTTAAAGLGTYFGRLFGSAGGGSFSVDASTFTPTTTDFETTVTTNFDRFTGQIVLFTDFGSDMNGYFAVIAGYTYTGNNKVKLTMASALPAAPANGQLLMLVGVSSGGGGSDPWATALPGSYSAGQAGHIVGTGVPDVAPGANGGLPTCDASNRVKIQSSVIKDVAKAAFEFVMYSSADHLTPTAGLTVTAQRSIDGAAFGACANSAAGVANGVYKIDLAASDLNGNVITLAFTAVGADPTLITILTTL